MSIEQKLLTHTEKHEAQPTLRHNPDDGHNGHSPCTCNHPAHHLAVRPGRLGPCRIHLHIRHQVEHLRCCIRPRRDLRLHFMADRVAKVEQNPQPLLGPLQKQSIQALAL